MRDQFLYTVGIVLYSQQVGTRWFRLTAGQIAATVIAVVLSAITVVALYVKKDSKRRVNWDTGTIFAIGFIGYVALFFIK